MRALILTAGLGTRLRPLTFARAKAAVPVNGEPMVCRIITWLVAQGICDLVLNLHHCPASIAGIVGDGRELGARVRYSWENPVLGSAGGPRHALPLLTDTTPAESVRAGDVFLIVNGDTLTDLPLQDLIDAHEASGALVTMALIPNPRPDVYGGVVVKDGRVAGFTRPGSSDGNYHFIGVQAASARAFAGLADGVPAESVGELYPRLLKEDPSSVAAHITTARFRDVGTPAEYWQTAIDFAEVEGPRLMSSLDVDIVPAAELRRTIVWDGVRIGRDSVLEDCIVCDGVQLGDRSVYKRCAIAPHHGEALRADEHLDGDLVVRPF